QFGPDGYLYVGLGDGGTGNNSLGNAQHIDRGFFSGILRIDVDKRPGNLVPNPSPDAASTTNYAVPADNPFVGATTFDQVAVNTAQLRTEFWAVGLRNPWRFSFDPVTQYLYCGDVGQDAYEEIDIITKGGNYGWATYEGTNTLPAGVNPSWPVPQNPIFGIVTYPHGSGANQGECVIGGLVYRGGRIPALQGSYLFADYVVGNFWRTTYDGTNATTPEWLFSDPGVAAFGVDPSNGDVLYANLENGNNSQIKRLVLGPLDFTRPTLKVLAPKRGARITNDVVTVFGTASDNLALDQVWCRLNNGPWLPAGGSNWSIDLTPPAGLNTVLLYAEDTHGNRSATNKLQFTRVVLAPVEIDFVGSGSVTPVHDGALLEIGKSYSVTAKPGKGYAFDHWSGATNSSRPGLKFVMASNLVFTAHFRDVQAPSLVILSPRVNQSVSTAPFTGVARASDNTAVDSTWLALNGLSYFPGSSLDGTNWTADFLPNSGANVLQGWAVDAAGNVSRTNTVKFNYQPVLSADWAPDTLSGLGAAWFADGEDQPGLSFDAYTCAQGADPTNEVYTIGAYAYTKLDTNLATLTLTVIGPPSQTNRSPVATGTIQFTNAYSGVFTNDDGPGRIRFYMETNRAPASISGKTFAGNDTSGTNRVSLKFSSVLFGGSTQVGSANVPLMGGYSFRRYSPVDGVIMLGYSTGPVGEWSYVQLHFVTATGGTYFSGTFTMPGLLVDARAGVFSLK
ncbi:MAG: PQQ-dependent sugar dehydrogenase, partial [Verrucomicrobiota bacterium]